MPNLQYIGARYVPIVFDNPDDHSADWKSGVTYESLTIVTYLNDSYTSRKPVPASVGDPASNPDYWAKTGDFNAGLTDLTNRVDNIEDELVDMNARISDKKRKFVLIGDSFSCGIRGGGQAWVTGWANYFESLFPDITFWYDPATDEHFEGVSAFTSVSDKNFIGQLNYVYNNKLGTTPADEITDVVVLGGSNEGSSTVSAIAVAIDTFCARSRELFPNANISIGCFGLNARAMVYDLKSYEGYKIGSQRNGAHFIESILNLGTLNEFDSGYGHFNENGYNFYNPYVAQAIVYGEIKFHFHQTFTLTLDTAVAVIPAGSFTFDITMDITERGTYFRLYDNYRYLPTILKLVTKIGTGGATREGNFLLFPTNSKLYTAFLLGAPTINAHFLLGDGTNIIPIGDGALTILNVSDEYVIRYKCGYPNPSAKLNDNTYDAFVTWELSNPALDVQSAINL